ncbi:glycoside hydrolase family 127 protein [Steroidobacter sp. S1-65]|uniref:Glycoside hydrolase family 127 protein n=1 Tax=Steroidobacter gossypii TaxID=2805490 RepID=A0ABS1X0T3_9GAMM|nr:glycoside hydrolase family 127 protein [Steroidobacter gossypii]MBM0106814.1 glycoside hydrolase family 127 protein [Steroidobacter gossypii]
MTRLPLFTDRRALLKGAAAGALCAGLPWAHSWANSEVLPTRAKPLPLGDVRLLPSPFADAVEGNRKYLLQLEPDRLLHNFRKFAGLTPKGEAYGGWEADTIAGHTLGHYLSALALVHAQTGEPEAKQRAEYIVAELAEVQAKQGDGYVAGFTRKRKDGTIVDGKEIFPEIMRGEIRSAGFDLNGCWVPLYNWHKLFAGLFDVDTYCGGNARAIGVAVGLGGYIEKVMAALNEEQLQTVLDCEHGGINESFAELYARTNDRRWLQLAERIYHKRVLDPLAAQRDELALRHANTQIPKLIGLARLHEITGKPEQATAARFFWKTVTTDHSYVIGGNSDREYFSEPRTVARHITEQTCEACNTYNMLKLTRHLYAWAPSGSLFDYYERAHLNHILAHQDPATGMFTYMTPLMSGARREFSSPTDSFWCCVGSGMESHAKHGDSIWWQAEDMLLINLFIPSRATWQARGAQFEMTTRYPYEGAVNVKVAGLKKAQKFAVALRVPGWAKDAQLSVNGKPVEASNDAGYLIVRRRWREGDALAFTLPLELRLEATPGDDKTIAFLHGPMVLAADLGPVDQPFEAAAPALVGADLLAGFKPVEPQQAIYRADTIARPTALTFSPFYKNYHRRSAVYFRRFTDAEWVHEERAFKAEQARLKELAARSVDVMHLGEMQPERDHELTSEISYPVVYRGRHGRDARTGGFFQFRMKVRPGPLILQATYWADERARKFHILVDGQRIATQSLRPDKPVFFDVDYEIPEALTRGKDSVLVRFEPEPGNTAGPVFGCRIYTQQANATAPI